jgi:hypothetical protein
MVSQVSESRANPAKNVAFPGRKSGLSGLKMGKTGGLQLPIRYWVRITNN